MSNQVKVVDNISKTVLFTTTIEKIGDAHAFALQMEEAGLDIKIIAPSLTETLIESLGASLGEIAEYGKSLQEEIDDHQNSDLGCSTCLGGQALENSKM